MEHDPENPSTNDLGPDLEEEDILKAIEYAGYPL